MKMTTRVAYCNMRHYKSKNILIGIAIILTTLLLFVIPSIGKDMVEVNFAVINKIYPTWHALYRNVDESTVMKLAAHHDVKTYGLRSDAGYMNLEDATVSMMYMDRTGMELYKVLFLNMSNIEDITLSDFDADTPSGKNWDEHVSCGEIPLVVYEALEDYEENSQVTLYNDTENSTELYKYLMEYVRKNGWTEEDIFQLLNTSVFYYLDGRKKSTIIDFYQDSDDIIETIEMVYGYDFTDIEQNFMFYIDAHDETENFVNLKGISMMELPLLKVEEEIFRRNDQ